MIRLGDAVDFFQRGMKPIFDLYRYQFVTNVTSHEWERDPIIDLMDNRISVLWGKCGGWMSRDALLLMLCHELGHMAGGPPYLEAPNFGEHSNYQSLQSVELKGLDQPGSAGQGNICGASAVTRNAIGAAETKLEMIDSSGPNFGTEYVGPRLIGVPENQRKLEAAAADFEARYKNRIPRDASSCRDTIKNVIDIREQLSKTVASCRAYRDSVQNTHLAVKQLKTRLDAGCGK